MRMSFAMAIVPNLKWLIFDEPTHNIDRIGIGKLVDVSNEKLPKLQKYQNLEGVEQSSVENRKRSG